MRGATFTASPWARAALPPAVFAGIGIAALNAGCHVNAVGRSKTGPWVVQAFDRDRRVEHRGYDLEAIAFMAISLWKAGATTTGTRFTAGPDGLAHGLEDAGRTLCGLRPVDPALAHPERARCSNCLRALIPAVAA